MSAESYSRSVKIGKNENTTCVYVNVWICKAAVWTRPCCWPVNDTPFCELSLLRLLIVALMSLLLLLSWQRCGSTGDAKRITGNIQRHRLHRYRRSCLLDSSGQERRTFSTAAKARFMVSDYSQFFGSNLQSLCMRKQSILISGLWLIEFRSHMNKEI